MEQNLSKQKVEMKVYCPVCSEEAVEVAIYSKGGDKRVQCPHCHTELVIVSNRDTSGKIAVIVVITMMLLHSKGVFNDSFYLGFLMVGFIVAVIMIGTRKFSALKL